MGIHKLYGVKIATAYSCPARPTPRSDHGSGGGSSLLGSGDLEATQQQEEWCLRSLWERRPNFLRAFHSSHRGDRNLVETVINVATSLPFVLIGIQMPRQKPLTRLYADSLIGVGLASTLFHASRGEARKYFRWGDYTMIATSTLCLSRALQTDSSKALYCASAMLLPFQPFVVAACHTGLMEAAFVRRALKQPSLQKAYTLHTISTVVGGTLFIADDMYPDTPFFACCLAHCRGSGRDNMQQAPEFLSILLVRLLVLFEIEYTKSNRIVKQGLYTFVKAASISPGTSNGGTVWYPSTC